MILEFHQPYRLNRNFNSLYYAGENDFEKVFNAYFDDELNELIFRRIAGRCYLPINELVLEQAEKLRYAGEEFKLAYSLSGLFVEQCKRWEPKLLELIEELVNSGYVELLGQTYYHSLSGLYDLEKEEFKRQVEMHKSLMREVFKFKPKVFENTECLYNNSIARAVNDMGFKGIVTEGADRVLRGRNPNYVYRAKGCGLKVLLRNYRLSDDIGFRFSSRSWSEWPLTSEKYVRWLESTPGESIVVFIDSETFGEHHSQESGILAFLKALAYRVVESRSLVWSTPSQILEKREAHGVIDVDDFETVSWADLERDTSAWLGNGMQLTVYESIKSLGPLVRSLGDARFYMVWRRLQSSDHLYYMSIKGGGSGDVHDYFNPYGSPYEAFTVYLRVLADFEVRLKTRLEETGRREARFLFPAPPDKAFIFCRGFARPMNLRVRSLHDLISALKSVDVKSIEFHNERGDFGRWVRHVIGDVELAETLDEIASRGFMGEKLRGRLIEALEGRITEIEKTSSSNKLL
ncbi:glycoside hydrolase family 57 protein [Candidatus Bathyarchaeota archaeon]|nr:glycoside hydrolase family 57 protein [Candidatus Bathyarchaeota archaeon]